MHMHLFILIPLNRVASYRKFEFKTYDNVACVSVRPGLKNCTYSSTNLSLIKLNAVNARICE